jgi:hypothetical protein
LNRSGSCPGEQEQQRERAGERELAKVAGNRHGLEHIAALDGALELAVQRPLRRHEQMFAQRRRRLLSYGRGGSGARSMLCGRAVPKTMPRGQINSTSR